MNVERILQLADVIERTPHKQLDWSQEAGELSAFNMSEWHCGTVGCIAGWTAQLFGGWCWEADKALDLPWTKQRALFRPDEYTDGRWEDITPSHAAAVLRNLAATGEVDWSVSS